MHSLFKHIYCVNYFLIIAHHQWLGFSIQKCSVYKSLKWVQLKNCKFGSWCSFTIALMSICHMPNNLICLYNDNELNALTHIFIGFMSNTKVTLSEFLFELKLNFHIISSPKQFSRGLQIFISIHTRMKFLVYGASGSIKIKYGFRP